MAGVTDRPFRQLCRQWGAGLAFSEMVSAQPSLRNSRKSQLRTDFRGETGLRAVQILGVEPELMAAAARYNVGNELRDRANRRWVFWVYTVGQGGFYRSRYLGFV